MAETAKWYVAHTYSGYEKAVKATIEKYVTNQHLEDIIVDLKIPTEIVTEIMENGTKKESERNVFPGYVLIKMVMTDDAWHLVRNIRGVTGFVGAENKPIPLSDEEALGLGIEKREIVARYGVGDQVRVTDGPMASFCGVVERMDLENNSITVRMIMAGREVPVELEADQVEALL